MACSIRLLILSFVLFSNVLSAQNERKVVILNMNNYNNESGNSRMLSVERTLKTAGIPFDTCSQLSTALNYPLIITGSRILDNVFSAQEVTDLGSWVNNGGVLIASSMRNSQLNSLFGILSNTSTDQLYSISFNTATSPELFEQIDDSLETTISIGKSSMGYSFFTRYYTLSSATSLAQYDNGECALSHHAFGNGHLYAFGPDFRDLGIRNHLDLDIEAQRIYSNGFEPSSDVIVFLIRNIIRKHISASVYKYPQPGDASSVLMITHDIDSKTGIDTMAFFSDWEYTAGIVAHYNITTRYMHDTWMTGFYLGSWSEIEQLKQNGHVLASHSVGHFPDFDNEAVFPYGNPGNIAGSYTPEYVGGITLDGTVLGELEVSRDLLSEDHSVPIRSFRAGHLCYHDSLYMGLQQMNYEFGSTLSANNILSSFPFYPLKTRSFSSEESTVLEIPMTISDVFNSDPISESNYIQKVGTWIEVTRKYNANNSPIVLLIHPNRMYKLTAQQRYIDSLPDDMRVMGFEEYGQFWRKRDSLLFHTELSNDTLLVQMDNNLLSNQQSFVIDMTGVDTVIFRDVDLSHLEFAHKNFGNNQRLYYRQNNSVGISENKFRKNDISVYPNPNEGAFKIAVPSSYIDSEYMISDAMGRIVSKGKIQSAENNIQLQNLQNGIYFIQIINEKSAVASKFLIRK